MRRSNCNRLPARGSRVTRQATVPSYIDTSLVAARAGLPDEAAIQQMASDFREAAGAGRGLDREDLERLGYAGKQIDRLHRVARLMANEQAAMT